MSKVSCLVFLNHLGNTTVGKDVSCVDESVKHLGSLLDLWELKNSPDYIQNKKNDVPSFRVSAFGFTVVFRFF
jgi:hypothetical protein